MPKPLPGKLSFVNAAELILREKDKSLHVKDIIAEALKRKLIGTKAKTPHSTLAS